MIIYNPYIIIPFLTWAIAQVAKLFVAAIRNHDQFDLRYLYASGGMPSAHSAVVCALAVTALLRSGADSAIFGLSVVMAAIVMYDSFGVRRAAGEQATAINGILDAMSRQKLGFTHPQQRLREILGHKPLEVTVGAMTGIVLGLVFNANYLAHQITWLTSDSSRREIYVYAAISLALIAGGRITSVLLRHRYLGSKVIKQLSKQITVMTLATGLLGLLLSFASYQKALYLGWRLWMYSLLVVTIIWMVALVGIYGQRLPAALAEEADHQRIRSWLPGKRKAKRKG